MFVKFLKIAKDEWKAFYYFTLLFVIGTLICAFIIVQTITPFFVFQMYSQTMPETRSYASYKLVINHKVFNTYQLSKEQGDILRTHLDRYLFLIDNDFKDKYYFKLKERTGGLVPDQIYSSILDFRDFKNVNLKDWLANFLKVNTSATLESAEIYKVEYVFNKEGFPELKNQTLKLKL